MTIQARYSVTIEDVARVAGVSRAAVSKVIRDAYGVSPEMRAKVQAAIDELGYRPRASARAMRGSSYTIGVEIPDIHNHFFPKIITGATTALADTRYQLIIAPAGPDHDQGPQAIEALADRQVDGIVAISSQVPQAWLENLGRTTPLVMIGVHQDSVNYDTLVGDDLLGATLAVRHLHDLGHRRIVHLTLAESRPNTTADTPHGLRVAGYARAVAGLGLEPEFVRVEGGQESARVGALALLSAADGPVGIFAAHDELALGVLQAVAELGLTAGQASVVGYDDTDIAAHPRMALTSINQSGTQMGAIAVRLILERIGGRTQTAHEVITPKVMARASTAAPQARATDAAGAARRQQQVST
ncbi:MAG: LacI family DNA-binding transcriptional regulator [Propionicimonas sp.]|nr:LacI family DNA-binding transcriptional regulator [Propionicimonas sp.]